MKMLKHGACICAKGTDLPCKVGEETLSQEQGSWIVGHICLFSRAVQGLPVQ